MSSPSKVALCPAISHTTATESPRLELLLRHPVRSTLVWAERGGLRAHGRAQPAWHEAQGFWRRAWLRRAGGEGQQRGRGGRAQAGRVKPHTRTHTQGPRVRYGRQSGATWTLARPVQRGEREEGPAVWTRCGPNRHCRGARDGDEALPPGATAGPPRRRAAPPPPLHWAISRWGTRSTMSASLDSLSQFGPTTGRPCSTLLALQKSQLDLR